MATLALAFAAVAARSDGERGVGPAQLSNPRGLAIDEDGTLYVADTGNHRVRAITATGEVATVTGTGKPSNSGDGRPATSAAVTDPGPVAIEAGGQLLISSGPVLRRIDTDGVIRTVVSDEADLATKAIAALADGSILVARPAQILRVAPDGTVDVFAGTGEAGFGGDGGPALTAQFNGIEQLAVDSGNHVFVVDSGNNRIRRISSDLTITTVAGTGGDRTSPDGRPALETDLPSPGGVAVDADGTIFVSEPALGRVRRIPVGGVVTTVAGDPDGYSGGFGGDGGPANDAQFGLLGNLAVNGDGTLFIIDITNNRVRAVTRQGEVTTVA